jgi:hypothetical protein
MPKLKPERVAAAISKIALAVSLTNARTQNAARIEP